MTRTAPQDVRRVACVGAGTIGSGWAAIFLARGLDVTATDPAPDAEAAVRRNVEAAWPALESLGLAAGASPQRLRFTPDPADAVAGAQFVQESAPDDEALKIALLADVTAACPPDSVIASSSSRFLPSRLAARCVNPGRIAIGHPFVPAYLVPLVEVVGGAGTDPETLDWLVAFYARMGKQPLRLKREIEAYLANRLQHALFEEAARLVDQGVCDWTDVETAITRGPGFRWPVVGPVLHRHLGGGRGGVRHMIDHFGWRGPPGGEQAFIEAVERRWGHLSIESMEAWRDENLVAMLKALRPLPLP